MRGTNSRSAHFRAGERRKTTALVIFCFLLIIAAIGASIMAGLNSRETVSAKVTDKERITTGSGDSLSSKWLVYTDGEVFENTDNLLFGKWNSADFQGRLQPGKTYRLEVAGWRVPWLSMYRNIIALQEETP